MREVATVDAVTVAGWWQVRLPAVPGHAGERGWRLANIRERREPPCCRALFEAEQQMTAKITVDTVIPRTRLKGQGTFPAGADLNDVNRVIIMSTPRERDLVFRQDVRMPHHSDTLVADPSTADPNCHAVVASPSVKPSACSLFSTDLGL